MSIVNSSRFQKPLVWLLSRALTLVRTLFVFAFSLCGVAAQSASPTPAQVRQKERGLGVRPTTVEKSPTRQPEAETSKPELVVQTGHNGLIKVIVFSPDGGIVATGGYDGTIKLWQFATGRLLRTLTGHQSYINAVAFSPDGRLLASASGGSVDGRFLKDNSVKIWDALTGEELRTLLGHAGEVEAVAFSPDGSKIASGSGDKTAKLWDARTGQELLSLDHAAFGERKVGGVFNPDGIKGVAFSPDGRLLACAVSTRFRDAPATNIVMWAADTGQQLRAISGRYDNFAFSPDNRWLIAGDHLDVQFFDMTFAADAAPTPIRIGLQAFSPDGRWHAIQHLNPSQISLVDKANGKSILLSGHTEYIRDLKFSPDASVLASASRDKTVRLWHPQSAQEQRTLAGHTDVVNQIAFSPDGMWLASASSDKTVRLWEVKTGREAHVLAGHAKDVRNVIFAPDGKGLVSVGDDTTVRLWEVSTGRELRRLSGIERANAITSSPDGRWLAVSSYYGLALWEWPAFRRALMPQGQSGFSLSRAVAVQSADGSLKASIPVLPSNAQTTSLELRDFLTDRVITAPAQLPARLSSVAISPDGRLLATAGFLDGGTLWDLGASPNLQPLGITMPQGINFSPDGRSLVRAYSTGIEVRDVATGKQLASTGVLLTSAAMSADGRLIAASYEKQELFSYVVWELPALKLVSGASYGARGAKAIALSPDGKWVAAVIEQGAHAETRIWNREKRDEFSYTTLAGGGRIAFSPDGRYFTKSAWGGQVTVFEVGTWVERQVIKEAGQVVSFSSDGRLMATELGKAVKVFETEAGRELYQLIGHTSIVRGVAFSRDGRWLATVSADDSTRIWDAKTGKELAQLYRMQNSTDWIVVTPEGLFDGTQPAIQSLVAWRFGLNETAVPELFFNEFYYPGLLAEIVAGKRPKPPRSIFELDRRQPTINVTLADGQAPSSGGIVHRDVRLRVEVTEAPGSAIHSTGSGARDVRLFRNGSLVKVWRGDVRLDKGRAVLEATVPIVAGENRLTAYAFNRDNIKSADAIISVTGAESLRRAGTAYIITVGLNQYENPEYNLKYAVADAQAFAAELQSQQTRLGGFGNIEVVPLLDRDATKANILETLRRLAGDPARGANEFPSALQKIKAAQPEDAVVVYFAGHGTAQGQRFYLIPHDLGYRGPRTALNAAGLTEMLAHSISDTELERAFEKVDARQLLFVIDACNSGQALEAEEKRRGPMNSKGLAQLAYEKGMYVLTAAQSYQAALEAAQLGHGYLTYALVEEGLKTPAADRAPKDGQVVAREWLDYATARVPRMQSAKMQEARELSIKFAFVEGEENLDDPDKKSVQRPRVFYRREPEAKPLIIAKP